MWILICILGLIVFRFTQIKLVAKGQKQLISFCESCVKQRLGKEKNQENYHFAKVDDLIILHDLMEELNQICIHGTEEDDKKQKEKISAHLSTLLFIKIVGKEGRSFHDSNFQYPYHFNKGDYPLVQSTEWSTSSTDCGKGLHFTTIDQFLPFWLFYQIYQFPDFSNFCSAKDVIIAKLLINSDQNLEESIEIVCAHNYQKVRAHAIQMICYIPNFKSFFTFIFKGVGQIFNFK